MFAPLPLGTLDYRLSIYSLYLPFCLGFGFANFHSERSKALVSLSALLTALELTLEAENHFVSTAQHLVSNNASYINCRLPAGCKVRHGQSTILAPSSNKSTNYHKRTTT
jgi:hypothetical protein